MKNRRPKIRRAIIADDEILKAMEIKRTLARQGISDVDMVRNQEILWEEIYRSLAEGKAIDLIVSDMQYPLAAGEKPDEESGLKLLARLKEEEIEIPVVICSSIHYRDIPGVLGCVWYNRLTDLEAAFREVRYKERSH